MKTSFRHVLVPGLILLCGSLLTACTQEPADKDKPTEPEKTADEAAATGFPGFNGKIELDVRDSTSDWTPFLPKRAKEGSPNILSRASA
jgi:hypothetical protein